MDRLYLVPVFYFLLGFVHMTFALLALLCMVLPFIMAYRDRRLSWCSGTCPRAGLFKRVGRLTTDRPVNRRIISKRTRGWVLTYFCINMTFILLSTVMVSIGRIAPIDRIRFLILFELPLQIPQVLELGWVPDALIHLSFRFYSVMLTSFLVGLILALVYKPRTWCAVCPVNSMTKNMLKKLESSENQR